MLADEDIIAGIAYGISESMAYVRMGYFRVAIEVLRMVIRKMKQLNSVAYYMRAHELVVAVDRIIWLRKQECAR